MSGSAGSFGRAMRGQWLLDPEITYLNHGTVGAPPRRVLEAQRRIAEEIERRPGRYLLRELVREMGHAVCEAPRLRAAAEEVAAFVGARGTDLVFVDNATTGLNAVLHSLPLREGDEILLTDHGYGSVVLIAQHVAAERGALVRIVELPYPPFDPGRIVASVERALGPRTRVLVIEHVTSESALVLPVAEIAACCRPAGVRVLVDGAHGPGAVPLDVPSLGADWYTGNLHKWCYAPRSSAFLWAAPERQEGLHPPVISWGYGRGFLAEFDWTGTRDPSPHLAAPAGIAFLRELGEAAVRSYNHALAWEAAGRLTSRWGTEWSLPEAMVGTMATVPLPEPFGSEPGDALRLRDAVYDEDRIEVQIHAWRDRLWARVSAQVYNDRGDVERLAEAIAARA